MHGAGRMRIPHIRGNAVADVVLFRGGGARFGLRLADVRLSRPPAPSRN